MRTKTAHTMRCTEATKYVCENLDEQLDSAKCRAIKKHLQSCKKCSRNLADLKRVIAMYQRESAPRLSRSVEKRLFAALKLQL